MFSQSQRQRPFQSQQPKQTSLKNLLKVNPLRANPTKWSDTLKQFFDKSQGVCLTIFYHFLNSEDTKTTFILMFYFYAS